MNKLHTVSPESNEQKEDNKRNLKGLDETVILSREGMKRKIVSGNDNDKQDTIPETIISSSQNRDKNDQGGDIKKELSDLKQDIKRKQLEHNEDLKSKESKENKKDDFLTETVIIKSGNLHKENKDGTKK